MKTNTKKNFLKLATMAFVLFFSVNAVNSQILTDYDNVAETVYQTAGKDFRLYVLPDAVYSPSYNAATNANLGVNALWAWSWSFNTVDDPTGKAAANENWVEMAAPVAGTYVFSVIESNSVILCPGAATTKTVEVIAAPTATITSTDITDLCGDSAAENIVVQITEGAPDALSAFSFKITELVETIDISDVQIAEIRTGDQVAFPLATKAKTGTTGFAYDASGDHTYTIATDALNVESGERTRYTYTLETVDAGVTGTGIVSAISQKSDYLETGVVNGHAFGAKTSLVFVVNPAPITGPIYHIPNNTNL